MKKKKRIIFAVLFLPVVAILSGFALRPASVAIDTEKERIYKYVSIDKIEQAFEIDKKAAANEYNNGFFLVSGSIDSIKTNGGSFSIKGKNSIEGIECKCDKKLRDDITKYKVYDSVAVYGKLSVDLLNREKHISVEKVINSPSIIGSSETYFSLGGEKFDYSEAEKRKLADERVEYYIPAKWQEIEVNIIEEKIGNIEGYQYVLNEMPGDDSYESESIFICYFDKNKLKEETDIERDLNGVEKAIIENIEGKVGKFPVREQKTYYGTKYKYYVGKYNDKMGNGYKTEYVFQEDKNNGIILVLYVYKDAKHLSDVMFVTRFLHISGQ